MDVDTWRSLLAQGGYDPSSDRASYELAEVLAPIHTYIEEAERTKIKQSISRALNVKATGKTDYVFLTVNFDPSKSFEECFKATQKLGNRQLWEWSAWVHEQRSESIEHAGTGHHVHLLAKLSKKNSNTARTKVKTFLSKFCDVRNHHIFNWKWILESYILDKYSYITDSKALEKQLKQVIDKSWRAANNISPIYYNAMTHEEIQEAYQEGSEETAEGGKEQVPQL